MKPPATRAGSQQVCSTASVKVDGWSQAILWPQAGPCRNQSCVPSLQTPRFSWHQRKMSWATTNPVLKIDSFQTNTKEKKYFDLRQTHIRKMHTKNFMLNQLGPHKLFSRQNNTLSTRKFIEYFQKFQNSTWIKFAWRFDIVLHKRWLNWWRWGPGEESTSKGLQTQGHEIMSTNHPLCRRG